MPRCKSGILGVNRSFQTTIRIAINTEVCFVYCIIVLRGIYVLIYYTSRGGVAPIDIQIELSSDR